MANEKKLRVEMKMTVSNDQDIEEGKRQLLIEKEVEQASQLFPEIVAASQTDHPLSLGGVDSGTFLLLETDTEITVKINNVGDTGFPVKGRLFIESETGITDVFVTTGSVKACISLMIGGS